MKRTKLITIDQYNLDCLFSGGRLHVDGVTLEYSKGTFYYADVPGEGMCIPEFAYTVIGVSVEDAPVNLPRCDLHEDSPPPRNVRGE